ncbi:MAG: hypothetical protein RBG13Loki_1573 [Promethearchaeota archaeon CR_4]|nr:MAG: hypothetical protein RBG13Loki_1573 [Candidatus Lokiarchaeota archaeon CR_4]
MPSAILILNNGLLAFYRSYGEQKLDDFDLTAGFFQAILNFSKLEVGENLETISMSDSYYYFLVKNAFSFILKEDRSSEKTREQIAAILEQLSDKFFQEFPDAASWNGISNYFAKFALACDWIVQARPTRKGFPILFRIALVPLFITPVLQVLPVKSENEETLCELQFQLKKYVREIGRKNLSTWMKQPFLIYLPHNRRIAYIISFHFGMKPTSITHLLCYITEEYDWFALYQLLSLFFKRSQYILPSVAHYLSTLEHHPISPEIKQDKEKIQEIVNNWADLNQYISEMHALLSEEFFKAGLASENLTEEKSRTNFLELLAQVGKDFDKALGAALGMRQVLFVGTNREVVEQALSAFLTFYPHPSVNLWTESSSDAHFIGTRPDLVKNYDESTVIVDLINRKVVGGEKIEFCANLLNETMMYAKEMSVSESHIFFQGKISAVFTLLKALLEVLMLEKKDQQKQFNELFRKYPQDSLQLMAQMSRNLNPLLAKILLSAKTS